MKGQIKHLSIKVQIYCAATSALMDAGQCYNAWATSQTLEVLILETIDYIHPAWHDCEVPIWSIFLHVNACLIVILYSGSPTIFTYIYLDCVASDNFVERFFVPEYQTA